MSIFKKTQIKDQYGFAAENTPMDEIRAVSPVRLAGATFVGTTIDPNFWTATLANNGTATQANNQVVLGASTTNNGSSILQSVARARYTGGSANRFRAQISFSTATASNVRRWGMFDGTDGAYFKLDGTDLKACVTRTGTANEVTVATLTKPTAGDVTTYEIYITNSKVYFVMAGTLVATHNATTATWTDTMNLPVRCDNINAGSTTNCTLSIRVATIYRFGELSTSPRYAQISSATTTILKYGAGMLHNIVVNNPTNNAITVYDNTSAAGSVIAIINPGASATPFALDYHVPFGTGLTIVTAGTPNITCVYE
jgi:hypothetical protein